MGGGGGVASTPLPTLGDALGVLSYHGLPWPNTEVAKSKLAENVVLGVKLHYKSDGEVKFGARLKFLGEKSVPLFTKIFPPELNFDARNGFSDPLLP